VHLQTVYHNGKFDALWMLVRFGVKWRVDFDTMLAHYMLDENDRHDLKYLAQKFLGAPDWNIDGKEKTSWSPRMPSMPLMMSSIRASCELCL
jgi:DNA polymerase I-like protein with 3'-5' exonuclease and polymerase domains